MDELAKANKEAYFARREKIAAAFACLSVVCLDGGIPYITVVPDKYARGWRVSDQLPSRHTDATAIETTQQIEALQNSLGDLLEKIDALKKPAFDALEVSFPKGVSHFRLQIIAFNMATLTAKPVATKKRGRQVGLAAPELVSELAEDFELLTGNKATLHFEPSSGKAGGDFYYLVESVFNTLGITASPEATIRKVLYGGNSTKNSN